jgi:hypothetical protein
MLQSVSKLKKRKVAALVAPLCLLIGSKDDDCALFMLTDWRCEAFIQNHIPVPPGFDQMKLVLKVWLAHNDDP